MAQSGSLFSADSWHDITFIAGEVRDPRANTAASAGARLRHRICCSTALANVAYLVVLPLPEIQNAPADRVATAVLQKIFPGYGPSIMAIAIMISTFGCVNSLVLAGAARLLRDGAGQAFLRAGGRA